MLAGEARDVCSRLHINLAEEACVARCHVLWRLAGRNESRICPVVHRRVAQPGVVLTLMTSEGRTSDVAQCERAKTMLNTIAIIFLILWLLGLMSGYSASALIHVLLLVAVVLFLSALVSDRRAAL
jgi:hypothetical protein